MIVAASLDASMCSTLIGTEAVADENATIAIALFDRFANAVQAASVDVGVAFQRVGTRGNASSCASWRADGANSGLSTTGIRSFHART